jgi:hypothetical protein
VAEILLDHKLNSLAIKLRFVAWSSLVIAEDRSLHVASNLGRESVYKFLLSAYIVLICLSAEWGFIWKLANKTGTQITGNPITGKVDTFKQCLHLIPDALIQLLWHIEADWDTKS